MALKLFDCQNSVLKSHTCKGMSESGCLSQGAGAGADQGASSGTRIMQNGHSSFLSVFNGETKLASAWA